MGAADPVALDPALLDRAARAIVERGGAAAFTGAGISVESGIPDFRSDAGLWRRFDPAEYASIQAFRRDPERVWTFLAELERMLLDKRPNVAHHALAELERAGFIAGIATQNVDGLHQAAGSTRVLELHGSGARLVCLACERSFPAGRGARDRKHLGHPPRCPGCGALLKPDVVLFGEELPDGVLQGSLALAKAAPVLLVIGTSAEVWPAAGIPDAAREAGSLVIEVNLEPTVLTGDIAEISLHGSAGKILPALAARVKALAGG